LKDPSIHHRSFDLSFLDRYQIRSHKSSIDNVEGSQIMQKRRAHNSGLPLTDADVQRSATSKSGSRAVRKGNKRGGGSAKVFVYSLVAGLMLGGLYLGINVTSGRRLPGKSRRIEESDLALPLSQYTSLEYALKHSRLVGLYFAASWCPMSTPVSELIDEHLGDMLLTPPSLENPPPTVRAPMSLVYVSSDRSVEDFLSYPRRKWISVPFESIERTALKKHFSVCAKPEMEKLGIDRKFEIPTLLILDGETHGVISTNGAEDLMEYQNNAFKHWMDLHDLVRAMEEKYGEEGHGSITTTKQRVDHAESISSLFA
jgi:hypothetical protein